ncbi:hypothetical protein GOV10_00110 [Candidatus Woesearchaeota archaeon]|nr:hypothetical protein [Candidatus Woesearchaeota archaeon]
MTTMQLKTCLAGTKNNGAVLRHFIIDTTLFVIHVEIEEDIIRIISARKATKKEGQQYRRFKS